MLTRVGKNFKDERSDSNGKGRVGLVYFLDPVGNVYLNRENAIEGNRSWQESVGR